MNRTFLLSLAVCLSMIAGCHNDRRSSDSSGTTESVGHGRFDHADRKIDAPLRTAATESLNPCRLVVAPQAGDTRLDREIATLQREIGQSGDPARAVERLGWMFVSKARISFDDGFYKLAELCALCLAEKKPGPEAMLLRGHVLHSLHRFKEAEPLARELTVSRGGPFDFGLLGDVLMEQGRLDEAVSAYQKMLDLKPDLHAYARAAHLRWLKGDLTGAIEAMQMATSASSPNDPESAAWVHIRLAGYQFQARRLPEAQRLCEAALQLQSNYPPALLLRGRLFLGEGRDREAVDALRKAVQLNPLPEYQWALTEALTAAGLPGDAQVLRTQLKKNGAASDPRTYAVYLASRGEDTATALLLAEAELKSRADVFTHDALAWCLAASGRWAEARSQMDRALAEGTQDARLFYHAAQIAAHAGQPEDARRFQDQAFALKHLLLPSERERLTINHKPKRI